MRTWSLIAAVVALGGCTEVYQGPRLVHYNPDWFYVRHAPLIDSRSNVDQLAAAQCPDPSRPAQLVDSAQYNPLDLRDATYVCRARTMAPPSPTETGPAAAKDG